MKDNLNKANKNSRISPKRRVEDNKSIKSSRPIKYYWKRN
jgi:hypothetical protein